MKQLAEKQKRLKDWKYWLEHETEDPAIKVQTSQTLQNYSELLFNCWEKGQISIDDSRKLEDLERRLEQLNEEARLRVVARSSGSAKARAISNAN